MPLTYVLREAGIPAWCLCLGVFAMPIWRMSRGRGRQSDPLLGIIFLLALNRQSFLFGVPPTLAFASRQGRCRRCARADQAPPDRAGRR